MKTYRITELARAVGLSRSAPLRVAGKKVPAAVDKTMWVSMLKAAGVSQQSMERWHKEFERRAPRDHHGFLASLGLAESEIARIRAFSARS